MHTPQRVFSFPVPDAVAGCCRTRSNRQSRGSHAAGSRIDGDERIALSAFGSLAQPCRLLWAMRRSGLATPLSILHTGLGLVDLVLGFSGRQVELRLASETVVFP